MYCASSATWFCRKLNVVGSPGAVKHCRDFHISAGENYQVGALQGNNWSQLIGSDLLRKLDETKPESWQVLPDTVGFCVSRCHL